MRRLLKVIAAVIAAPIVLLAILAIALALAPDPSIDAAPGDAIGGIFHVHAEASHDGYGTLLEAVAAAREAGADFLVLTEHNAIRPSAPEVVDGVLVVPGVEISAQAGHVIALGAFEVPPNSERGPTVLEAIAARGGASILAHPINLRRPWSDPSTDGFAGFEVLSLDSAFREAKARPSLRVLLALAALVGAPEKTGALIMDRPAGALERYDELTRMRDVALMCGVDAHGLPPYPASFGSLRLHFDAPAWGADPLADTAALRRAIREARTFCSVPALGDASSFAFGVEGPDVLVQVAAARTTLVLFRDGVEVARGAGPTLRYPAGPGVWRAEVLIDEPGFPFADGAFWIASSAMRLPASHD
jgi:hypothetical protein